MGSSGQSEACAKATDGGLRDALKGKKREGTERCERRKYNVLFEAKTKQSEIKDKIEGQSIYWKRGRGTGRRRDRMRRTRKLLFVNLASSGAKSIARAKSKIEKEGKKGDQPVIGAAKPKQWDECFYRGAGRSRGQMAWQRASKHQPWEGAERVT